LFVDASVEVTYLKLRKTTRHSALNARLEAVRMSQDKERNW